MNRLYSFQVPDGRLKTNLWVSAPSEAVAMTVLSATIPKGDVANTAPPVDVTDKYLGQDRTNLAEMLKGGIVGTVTKSIPYTTPNAMVQALLAGVKPSMQGKSGWNVSKPHVAPQAPQMTM